MKKISHQTFQKVFTFSFAIIILLLSNSIANCAIFLDANTDLTTITFESHTSYELTPQAVYEVSSSVIISNDCITIIGNNAIIKKTATADALRITGNRCKIIGVEIDGNDREWCGIFITGSHNIIDSVISYRNGGHGIGLDGQITDCRYNRILNCTSRDNAGIGFSMNTGGNNILQGNIAIRNDLEGFTCDGMAHTGPSYGNIFSNNICQGNKGGVGGIGIDFAIDNIFTGNIIDRNNKSGLKTQNNQGSCFDNTFTGNIFVNNGGYGIEFSDGTGGPSHHNKMFGNIFRNNRSGDIYICDRCYENVTP